MLTKENKVLLILAMTFITMLVISNIIAIKTISIGGLIGPAAVLCYSLTFAISDTLSEIWGRKTTQFIINIGFGATMLASIFVKLAIWMPGSPFWQHQEAFESILNNNFRIVAASMIAYYVSQSHDVWAFHFWKKKTNNKHLWIRNNLSSMVSQLIDTVLFISIAFYGSGTPLFQMMLGQYLIKLFIAAIDTPLVYGLVFWIRHKTELHHG